MIRPVLVLAFAVLLGAGCQPMPPASAEAHGAAADVELRAISPGVWIHTSYYTYPSGTRFPSNGLVVREVPLPAEALRNVNAPSDLPGEGPTLSASGAGAAASASALRSASPSQRGTPS